MKMDNVVYAGADGQMNSPEFVALSDEQLRAIRTRDGEKPSVSVTARVVKVANKFVTPILNLYYKIKEKIIKGQLAQNAQKLQESRNDYNFVEKQYNSLREGIKLHRRDIFDEATQKYISYREAKKIFPGVTETLKLVEKRVEKRLKKQEKLEKALRKLQAKFGKKNDQVNQIMNELDEAVKDKAPVVEAKDPVAESLQPVESNEMVQTTPIQPVDPESLGLTTPEQKEIVEMPALNNEPRAKAIFITVIDGVPSYIKVAYDNGMVEKKDYSEELLAELRVKYPEVTPIRRSAERPLAPLSPESIVVDTIDGVKSKIHLNYSGGQVRTYPFNENNITVLGKTFPDLTPIMNELNVQEKAPELNSQPVVEMPKEELDEMPKEKTVRKTLAEIIAGMSNTKTNDKYDPEIIKQEPKTEIQEQIDSTLGIDNEPKSAENSAKIFEQNGFEPKTEIQEQIDSALGIDNEAKDAETSAGVFANNGFEPKTEIQEQIDSALGIDNEPKDAEASAKIFEQNDEAVPAKKDPKIIVYADGEIASKEENESDINADNIVALIQKIKNTNSALAKENASLKREFEVARLTYETMAEETAKEQERKNKELEEKIKQLEAEAQNKADKLAELDRARRRLKAANDNMQAVKKALESNTDALAPRK